MNGYKFWKAHGLTKEGAALADRLMPAALALAEAAKSLDVDVEAIMEAAAFEVFDLPERSASVQAKLRWTRPEPQRKDERAGSYDPSWLENGNQVRIVKTNEHGWWEYAVVRADDEEFWLWSFERKKDAAAYCKRHGLKVKR
jgi:hypothetical protein